MKIGCLNCGSQFELTKLKGSKDNLPQGNKVITRCPMCTDIAAYVAHPVPDDEYGRDRLRLIMLHDHVWPRAASQCAQGRKDPKKMLSCAGCQSVGVISADFCSRAQKYNELLLKPGPEAETTTAAVDGPGLGDEEEVRLSLPGADFNDLEDGE